MNYETLKVGDVLKVTNLKLTDLKIYHIIIISIVHFQQDVYFNCMFFCEYKGLERTDRFFVTFTLDDFDIYKEELKKIDV